MEVTELELIAAHNKIWDEIAAMAESTAENPQTLLMNGREALLTFALALRKSGPLSAFEEEHAAAMANDAKDADDATRAALSKGPNSA